jgi:hypothetical protein
MARADDARRPERDARARFERSCVSVVQVFFRVREKTKKYEFDENVVRNVSISKTRARVSLVSRRIASYRVVSRRRE